MMAVKLPKINYGYIDPKSWNGVRYNAQQRRLTDLRLRRVVKKRSYKKVSFTEMIYHDEFNQVTKKTYNAGCDYPVCNDNRELVLNHPVTLIWNSETAMKKAIDSYVDLNND